MAAVQSQLGKELLNQRCIKDWLILTRNDFDCVVLGDPYLAQSFWLHLGTGRFINRVWNKTFVTGYVTSPEFAAQKIRECFESKAPCLGIVGVEEENEVTESYTISDLPYKRKISASCLFLVNRNQAEEEEKKKLIDSQLMCEPCLVMQKMDAVSAEIYCGEEEEEAEDINMDEDQEINGGDQEIIKESEEEADWAPPKNKSTAAATKATVAKKPVALVVVEKSTGVKKFECLKCSQVFAARDLLYKHQVRQHHRGHYKCSHCQPLPEPSQFSSLQYPEELEEHLKASHPDVNDVCCSICENRVSIETAAGYLAHVVECKKEKEATKRLKFLAEKERTGYQCQYCDLTFTTEFKRQTHHNNDHLQREKKVYKCQICDRTFTHGSAMKKHMSLNHAFGSFSCPAECSATTFEFADDFLGHLSASHPKISSALCDNCNEEVELSRFKVHNLSCKKEMASIKSKNYKASVKARGVKCRYCDKVLENHHNRMMHEHKEHKGYRYMCDQCDYKTCYKQQFFKHRAAHEGNIEKACCEQCGKEMTKENLKAHIQYVHEGKVDNATCEVCGTVFTRKMQLEKHKILEHGIGDPFVCKVCGKAFGSRANLHSHKKAHMEGTFVCKTCGKTSKTRQNHEIHERTHTGEKPFK